MTMADDHTTIWNMFLQEEFQFLQLGYTIANEIYLSITAHFKVDCINNRLTVKSNQLGMDRVTVRWRCTHDTHITRSHQRELQGTRYWSSTHGQRINIHLELAQLFFG